MALDSAQKRQCAAGAGRPYMRSHFPVATPTEAWRINAGNAYCGNALTPAAPDIPWPVPLAVILTPVEVVGY